MTRPLVGGVEKPRVAVIVPARYGSTRLPGKALVELLGKPLVLWVLERAQGTGADYVAVATDDRRIAEVVEKAGGRAVMTRSDHASGTDRLAEVADIAGFTDDTIVVNLQGDEPLIEPSLVASLAADLATRPAVAMATLATPIREAADRDDPNVVKVVLDRDGRALYFSRSRLPYERNAPEPEEPFPLGLRHLGLYAYRAKTLRDIAAHPPVGIEQQESLEQLRALWLGHSIYVRVVDEPLGHGVDTPEDVLRVEAELRKR